MKSKLTKRFAVYVDWTIEEISRPFYIGKGNQVRVNGRVKYNAYWLNIMKKYGVRREVVFESDNESEVLAREIQLIQELRTYVGFENSFGANMTLGGEGCSGHHPSDATRQKMSESHLLAWQDDNRRRLASETQKKRWASEEIRQEASEKYSRVWSDLDLRNKMSQIIKDACAKPETRRKRSEASKKKWENLSSEAYAKRCQIASAAAKRREEARRVKREQEEVQLRDDRNTAREAPKGTDA